MHKLVWVNKEFGEELHTPNFLDLALEHEEKSMELFSELELIKKNLENLQLAQLKLEERQDIVEKRLGITSGSELENLRFNVRSIISKSNPQKICGFDLILVNGIPKLTFSLKENSVSAIEEAARLEIIIQDNLHKKIIFSD